jgi:hypothetical protein
MDAAFSFLNWPVVPFAFRIFTESASVMTVFVSPNNLFIFHAFHGNGLH